VDAAAEPQPTEDARSPEQLAAGAAAGSSACFAALVDRLGPRLLRYLHRRVGDLHTAEDLLQDTFLKAYRNLGRYDPSRSFTTWLFTIGTRLAISHFRSRRVAVPIDEIDPPDATSPGPAETVAGREERTDLWALASRVLPGPQMAALWLRYAEEMPVRDVAEAMGRTVTGVKVLLYRARRRLMDRADDAGRRAASTGPVARAAHCVAET
jgi:RNA polymerase sigma-70 factor (ECF subfamily)